MAQEISAMTGSAHGLSTIQRHAIAVTNAKLLSIRPMRTHFNEILFKSQSSNISI